MRPAMGRAQEAHWAVGRLWKGDQCVVELVTGAVDEWWGSGRLKGLGRLLIFGSGSARGGGVSSETEMLGTEGVGSLIEGTIEETESLMIGTIGASSMRNVGGSATLVVGTIGAELVGIGSRGFGRSSVGSELESSWIEG